MLVLLSRHGKADSRNPNPVEKETTRNVERENKYRKLFSNTEVESCDENPTASVSHFLDKILAIILSIEKIFLILYEKKVSRTFYL